MYPHPAQQEKNTDNRGQISILQDLIGTSSCSLLAALKHDTVRSRFQESITCKKHWDKNLRQRKGRKSEEELLDCNMILSLMEEEV
jgi:hypothetical protein